MFAWKYFVEERQKLLKLIYAHILESHLDEITLIMYTHSLFYIFPLNKTNKEGERKKGGVVEDNTES